MNSQQLAEHIGVSYRQVHYWTSRGYLMAENAVTWNGRAADSTQEPGSGFAWSYSDDEVRIAARAGVTPKRTIRAIISAQAARAGTCGLCGGRLLTEGAV